MAGSTRQRISRSDLGKIEIPVFPTKEEQDELASVFVDMDKEIAGHGMMAESVAFWLACPKDILWVPLCVLNVAMKM